MLRRCLSTDEKNSVKCVMKSLTEKVMHVHDTLRKKVSEGVVTGSALFNSMAVTIHSDVHRNALMELCSQHSLLVAPIALFVMQRFERQFQDVMAGKTLADRPASESDAKWELMIADVIEGIDLTTRPQGNVDMCVWEMLHDDLHIRAMYQVCRQYKMARPFVQQRLSAFGSS